MDVKSKPEKKVGPLNVRAKGIRFEQEVARALKYIFPNAERQLEVQVSDCQGTDLRGTDPFQFQCKRLRQYAPIARIEEVQKKTKKHVPVLVTRGDHVPAVAVLYFEDFVNLVEQCMGKAPGEEETVPENNVNDETIEAEDTPANWLEEEANREEVNFDDLI